MQSTYRQFLVNQQGFGLNNLDVIHFKEPGNERTEESEGDWFNLCVSGFRPVYERPFSLWEMKDVFA